MHVLVRLRGVMAALQVPVNEWRSGLWQQALQSLGIEKPQMAEALQERFRASRLEHFALDTGVKVGRFWHPRQPCLQPAIAALSAACFASTLLFARQPMSLHYSCCSTPAAIWSLAERSMQKGHLLGSVRIDTLQTTHETQLRHAQPVSS